VPLQILFINLATDGLPAITLSMEKGEGDVMSFPPRDKRRRILAGTRSILMAGHAISLAIAAVISFLLGLYFHTGHLTLKDILPDGVPDNEITCRVMNSQGDWNTEVGIDCAKHGLLAARTMVFLTICFSENLRVFTVRSFHGPLWSRLFGRGANWWLVGASAISTGLTLFVWLTPSVQDLFDLTYISWHAWLIPLAGALFTMIVDEWVKSRVREDAVDHKRWGLIEGSFASVLNELRAVRYHVVDLERQLAHHQQAMPHRRDSKGRGSYLGEASTSSERRALLVPIHSTATMNGNIMSGDNDSATTTRGSSPGNSWRRGDTNANTSTVASSNGNGIAESKEQKSMSSSTVNSSQTLVPIAMVVAPSSVSTAMAHNRSSLLTDLFLPPDVSNNAPPPPSSASSSSSSSLTAPPPLIVGGLRIHAADAPAAPPLPQAPRFD
jgi:hypothetical protein